jgi:aspartate/methionine/tyrosine aminotransferase
MRRFQAFAMERWQSTYENEVRYNLSESGVHPLTVGELRELAGDSKGLDDLLLLYNQSNGTRGLREEIARMYPNAVAENVSVTNGSAEANFAAIWELVDPGNEIAMVLPAYMQTRGLSEMFGATVREIHLRKELGWQPDPDDVAAAIGSRTRLVVVTNPNNPTGVSLNAEARAAILSAADKSGAWILADEVYRGAELAGPETASFWDQHPRVIATGSLSKAYGLPGLRIGWVIAPPEVAERLWARTDYTTIAPATLSDHLATMALRREVRSKVLARTRAILSASWQHFSQWADDCGLFEYRAPDAGAICFLRYDLPVNSSELAERLRAEQSVLIVPGDQFGIDHHIRIGYGLLPGDLLPALERVKTVFESIRA